MNTLRKHSSVLIFVAFLILVTGGFWVLIAPSSPLNSENIRMVILIDGVRSSAVDDLDPNSEIRHRVAFTYKSKATGKDVSESFGTTKEELKNFKKGKWYDVTIEAQGNILTSFFLIENHGEVKVPEGEDITVVVDVVRYRMPILIRHVSTIAIDDFDPESALRSWLAASYKSRATNEFVWVNIQITPEQKDLFEVHEWYDVTLENRGTLVKSVHLYKLHGKIPTPN